MHDSGVLNKLRTFLTKLNIRLKKCVSLREVRVFNPFINVWPAQLNYPLNKRSL